MFKEAVEQIIEHFNISINSSTDPDDDRAASPRLSGCNIPGW